MENKIRKLAIGAEVKERFLYVVNDTKPIFAEISNNKRKEYFVHDIIECKTKYQIWLRSENEIHHWKDEMKNEFCHPEYFIN
jgi:hypothetical protein